MPNPNDNPATLDTLEANKDFRMHISNGEQLYELERERERIQNTTPHRFTCARDGLVTTSGKKKKQGDPLTVVELGGIQNAMILARRGWIVMLDPMVVQKRHVALDAEWIVAKPLCASREFGVLEEGDPVEQHMFARTRVPTKLVWDTTLQAEIHVHAGAKPNDGSEQMANYIERGCIVPGPKHKGKASDPKQMDVKMDRMTGQVTITPKKAK